MVEGIQKDVPLFTVVS